MFLQLLDWLSKLVGILNNSNVLSNSRKRKKIGKQFLAIYSCISEISLNAKYIQDNLKWLLDNLKEKINDEDFDKDEMNLQINAFIKKLSDQRVLLRNLDSSICDGIDSNIMRIYGGNNDFYKYFFIGKDTFLGVISEVLDIYRNETSLPRTFNLMDYEEIETLKLPFYTCSLIREKGIFTDDDPSKIFEQLFFLYDQMIKFDSVRKLERIKKSISKIIKENFKIEELF